MTKLFYIFSGLLMGLFLGIFFTLNFLVNPDHSNMISYISNQSCFFSLTKKTSLTTQERSSFCLNYSEYFSKNYRDIDE